MQNLNRIVINLISLIVFLILLFAFTKIFGAIPFETTYKDVFSATGVGKVDVKPDSVTVRLGVVQRGASSNQAKLNLDTNINNVIESIKGLGIDEKDIKTENYNIYPEYEVKTLLQELQPEGETVIDNKITGYTANSNIIVSVDSAEMANKVLDAGSQNGANQVGGVDFQLKDKEEALNKAREIAVVDAKKKAENAAKIAGFKLGKVINYSESEGGSWPVPYLAKAEGEDIERSETDIQPGMNEIVLTVNISYEIK